MKRLIAAVTGLFADSDSPRKFQVAVVASQIVKLDGTSNAVRDTLRAVATIPDWDVSVFAHRCAFPQIPIHRVRNARKLALHPRFAAAAVVIYHF